MFSEKVIGDEVTNSNGRS